MWTIIGVMIFIILLVRYWDLWLFLGIIILLLAFCAISIIGIFILIKISFYACTYIYTYVYERTQSFEVACLLSIAAIAFVVFFYNSSEQFKMKLDHKYSQYPFLFSSSSSLFSKALDKFLSISHHT